MKKLFLILLFSLFLVSCSSKFACKDKVNIEGEKCDSITEVYEKKMMGDGSSPALKEKEKNKTMVSSEDVEAIKGLFFDEEKPIRLPPRVIRIWIAPWEDSDGDLHQPSYIYSEISPKRGRWLFGEKEVATGSPILRPMEKPVEDQKIEGDGKGSGVKKESKVEDRSKREEERKIRREKQGDSHYLPVVPDTRN